MEKMLTWLRSAWFVTAMGLLFIALVIWLGGPYLGFGQSQPLASPAARLVVILLLVLGWVAWRQIAQWRAGRKAEQLSGDMAGQDARPLADDRMSAERTQLQTRFQEAVNTLRKTRRGGGRNLYALPWYVVIGAPGSGKSTLLQHSGLDFPLAERFGKDALRGIGGTRNCDWWFTDEAVFLDTAGRYTSQDSDANADASAWGEFLKLLRKYRRRRPLNGVIVTMSMSDMLVSDEAGRQQHVRSVRHRLDELTKHLGVGVPVYLVFTKCDLIAGFSEFFDDMGPDLRSQVWGMTFPAERTIDGSAASMFDAEFDLLMDRLNTRILERLHAERDRRRRAAVLSFPQQLGALRELCRQFVEGVFSRHQYGQTPMLRGAYLTSGTQEGAPIDRMLSAVARTFGVDAARVQPSRNQPRTFFVERLLKDVLFRESGFAGTNPAFERRKIVLQITAYAGIVLFAVLMICGFVTSYARNRAYVAQVQEALKDFPARDDLTGAATPTIYFARVLQRLEILSGSQAVATQYQDHVPWSMRFGLYEGGEMTNEVHGAYLRELNGTLLPGVGVRFREGLGNSAGDPQVLYDYLKGYLMLGEPSKRDARELAALACVEWQRVFPADPSVQKALDKHFRALLDDPQKPRALSLDQGLVEQARATLRAADLSTLIYGNLKLAENSAGDTPVRLDEILGLLGNAFRRKSGASMSQPMPALYTQPVFAAEVNGGIDQAVDQFVKDDWVFGSRPIDALQRSRLSEQVLDLYQQDYIKTWDGLLGDIQLQPIVTIQDASVIAAKLSGPSSPLKALLELVRDNTSDLLRAAPSTASTSGADNVAIAAGVGKNLAKQRVLGRSQLARELADASANAKANASTASNDSSHGAAASAQPPGTAISQHFDALDRLTTGGAGATPIDHTLGVLSQLSKALLSMGNFSDANAQSNPDLLAARQEASQLPPPISDWIAALSGKSVALVANGASGALSMQFKQAAGSDCGSFVNGRYPFASESSADIPIQNFAELFGNGGRFDSFFKQTLAKLVDTSGRTWRWSSGTASGPPGLLPQAQIADDIRQTYFHPGSSQPEVDFTVTMLPLAASISKLLIDIDGQKYAYQAGASDSLAMKWPGPQPGHMTISAWDKSGRALPSLTYQGDWAFFRALQAASVQRQGDLRYLASFRFAGAIATLIIQPSSLKNPFGDTGIQRFRCAG